MTTYQVTFYRQYLPHPERDEPQRELIVARSQDEVINILADCEVTTIEAVDEVEQVTK